MSEEANTGNKPKDAIEVVYERAQAENLRLKTENENMLNAIDELSRKLARANELIEHTERAKVRDELRQMGCTYGMEELDTMALDELENLKRHYKYFNPPFKSGSDIAKPVRKNIYDELYEKYIPVEERQKQMREG